MFIFFPHFILKQSLAQISCFHKGVLALEEDCKIFISGKDIAKHSTCFTERNQPTQAKVNASQLVDS